MPKFDVHLFPPVRVKVRAVEAGNLADAVRKAIAEYESDPVAYVGAAYPAEDEQIPMALVDVCGDEDFSRSRWVALDGEDVLPMWVQEGHSRQPVVAVGAVDTATVACGTCGVLEEREMLICTTEDAALLQCEWCASREEDNE